MHPATDCGNAIARALESELGLPGGTIDVKRSPNSAHTWFFATPPDGGPTVSTEISDADMADGGFQRIYSRLFHALEIRLRGDA